MLRALLTLGACAALLAACADEEPSKGEAAAPVDMTKVERVAADFHFQFFDERKQPVALNDAELAAYLNLRDARAETFRAAYKGDGHDGGRPGGGDDGGLRTPPAVAAYTKRCTDAGVPIPPPWQEGNWTQVGALPLKPRIKIHSGPEHNPVEIWEAPDPKGLCVAVTRKVRNSADTEVGVICQAVDTGKTCFWALRDPATQCTKPFPLAQQKGKTPDQICSGDTMAQNENCTECHRGKNAFIVHPRTALAVAFETPTQRYTPVPVNRRIAAENPTWENDGLLKLPNDQKCGGCHAFSTPRLRWCNLVLKGALGNLTNANIKDKAGNLIPLAQTMPVKPDRFETLIPRKDYLKDFKGDLRALRAACLNIGPAADIGITAAELR